jgi:hypothetical protein
MGRLARLVDRIDRRVDRPADQTVLSNPRGGSERIIEAQKGASGQAAAANVRQARDRSRRRWIFWSRH